MATPTTDRGVFPRGLAEPREVVASIGLEGDTELMLLTKPRQSDKSVGQHQELLPLLLRPDFETHNNEYRLLLDDEQHQHQMISHLKSSNSNEERQYMLSNRREHRSAAFQVLQGNRVRHSGERFHSFSSSVSAGQGYKTYDQYGRQQSDDGIYGGLQQKSFHNYNTNQKLTSTRRKQQSNSSTEAYGSGTSFETQTNRFVNAPGYHQTKNGNYGTNETKKVSVKVRKVTVPKFVDIGDDVRLDCNYNTSVFKLYSLKWYLNEVEIFRYIPGDIPPMTSFPRPGINIDVSVAEVTD